MKTGRRNFLKGLLGASVAPIIAAPVAAENLIKEKAVKNNKLTNAQIIKIMLSSVPITYKYRGGPADVLTMPKVYTKKEKAALKKSLKMMTKAELIVHGKEFYGITFG